MKRRNEMKEYILFLDESKMRKDANLFCLAGYIISKEDYENILIPAIANIKKNILHNEDIILHYYDIKKNINGFENMTDKKLRAKFFKELIKLISLTDLYIIGACIDCKLYKNMYYEEHVNDEYFITLQIILENFVHFLITNDAKGSICVEARTSVQNKKLQNHYYHLMSNGTLYFNSNTVQTYLSSISFPLKADNNVGLQLADFVPVSLIKTIENKKDYYGLGSLFLSKAYKGYGEQPERFGFKNLL